MHARVDVVDEMGCYLFVGLRLDDVRLATPDLPANDAILAEINETGKCRFKTWTIVRHNWE